MSQSEESRQGIALVIVLAFLTILILMAVLFVTLMRTERVASRNHMDIVRARHFVHTGMARALEEIQYQQTSSVGQPLFQPYARDLEPPVNRSWVWTNNSMYSMAQLQQAGINESIHLLGDGDLRSFFPYDDAMWDEVVVDIQNRDYVEWEVILDQGDVGDLLGRVSYWIFDCSGLLDVMTVHGSGVPREWGLNPGEIRLSDQMTNIRLLPELDTMRTDWVRFASIAEFAGLATTSNQFLFPAAGGRPPRAPGFFNVSYFPTGHWSSVNSAVEHPGIHMAGNRAEIIEREPEIRMYLENERGMTPTQLEQFWANLLDYLDDDRLPGGGIIPDPLRTFCTEAVPMINEVRIQHTLAVREVGGGTNEYLNRVDVDVEVWYPFVGVSDPPGLFKIEVDLRGLGPNVPVIDAAQRRDILPGPWSNNFIRSSLFTATNLVVATVPPPLPTLLRTVLRVLNGADLPVDEISIVENWQEPEFLDAYPSVAQRFFRKQRVKEVIDPRINWEWSSPSQWRDVDWPGSIGAINPSATDVYTQPGKDGGWEMYVADGPMRNAGELGFLLYDETKPWETVQLFGTNQWPIYFDFSSRAEIPTRGLVNPHSPESEVLAAVFHELPLGMTPEAGRAIDWPRALDIADWMIREMPTNSRVNAADLLDLDLEDAAHLGALGSKLDLKSLVRQSWELFSARQQFFTIVVEGQALAPGTDPNNVRPHEILASQKALAVIWRDPFGEEPTITQYFEWLTD